jgi:hypothetical protein
MMIYLFVEKRFNLRGVCLNMPVCIHILFSVFFLRYDEISLIVNILLTF